MMTLRQRQSVFARNLARLILRAGELGYEVTIGEVERTAAQQQLYLHSGASRTLNSQHLKRLAADLNLYREGVWLTKAPDHASLGAYWVSLHADNRWGGDFRRDGGRTKDDAWDPNHYEMMG